MPGIARTVERMLDALGYQQVDVLGASLGGVIAQQLAHQAPHRVRRLVLAATGPGLGGIPGSPRTLLALATPRRYHQPGHYQRIAARTYGGATRRRPVPGQDAAADGRPAGELLRHRPRQRGQLHRAGLRAGPYPGHPGRLPVLDSLPGPVVARPYHQVLGEGCVYPAAVPTLGNQLSAAGRSWAAYLQDMGNDPGRDNTVSTARGPACGHPATGSIDRTERAERGDQYAARHDGFTFFRSITANPAFCAAHILSFRPLPGDLARAGATPAFSFLAPNLCNDGHDATCADGAPGGLAQADRFLAHWVPVIMAAPAYQDGGLIVITFDEGSDAAACCGETSGISPSHLNVPLPGKTGPGGGRIGAVLLYPLIRPGTVSAVQYNHYSLLRTIEDIFGLPHLGDAAMPQARSFGADIFA